VDRPNAGNGSADEEARDIMAIRAGADQLARHRPTAWMITRQFGISVLRPRLRKIVFVDVGAKVGDWTRLGAALGWRTIAIEPNSSSFAVLDESFGQHADVTLFKLAVADENLDAARFYTSDEYAGRSSLRVNDEALSEDVYELVRVRRLADLLDGVTDHVDLMKTDIEGADLLALRGSDLSRYRPALVVSEISGRCLEFGYRARDMVEYMIGQGYVDYVVMSSYHEDGYYADFFDRYAASASFHAPGSFRDAVFVRHDVHEDFVSLFADDIGW
jgi:FkbM family methyltransferase